MVPLKAMDFMKSLASVFAVSTSLTIVFDWLRKIWEKLICKRGTNEYFMRFQGCSFHWIYPRLRF